MFVWCARILHCNRYFYSRWLLTSARIAFPIYEQAAPAAAILQKLQCPKFACHIMPSIKSSHPPPPSSLCKIHSIRRQYEHQQYLNETILHSTSSSYLHLTKYMKILISSLLHNICVLAAPFRPFFFPLEVSSRPIGGTMLSIRALTNSFCHMHAIPKI